MEQSWRWFGPDDAVQLSEIRQAGASAIVTALHEIPYGVTWDDSEIGKRKSVIEADTALGLRWNVVESLPVAEAIKQNIGNLEPLFENYRQSLRNLAAHGIKTVCYNFMPVVDWTRTQSRAPLPGGGTALRFDATRYTAFDCFILARANAEADYDPALVARAKAWADTASEFDKDQLLATIMAGLPGAYDRYDVKGLRHMLDLYRDINCDGLRENLVRFLRAVVPTAAELGMKLAIHPDDPPMKVFGLPRICATAEDLAFITSAVDETANGITLCTGALGARAANNVLAIAKHFASRVHFLHLRNVAKEPDGSFQEAAHLDGDTDMVAVIDTMLAEQQRRKEAGHQDWRLPMRPDHGHELIDDARRKTHPGYPLIGRLRGLAELRGVIRALAAMKGYAL